MTDNITSMGEQEASSLPPTPPQERLQSHDTIEIEIYPAEEGRTYIDLGNIPIREVGELYVAETPIELPPQIRNELIAQLQRYDYEFWQHVIAPHIKGGYSINPMHNAEIGNVMYQVDCTVKVGPIGPNRELQVVPYEYENSMAAYSVMNNTFAWQGAKHLREVEAMTGKPIILASPEGQKFATIIKELGLAKEEVGEILENGKIQDSNTRQKVHDRIGFANVYSPERLIKAFTDREDILLYLRTSHNQREYHRDPIAYLQRMENELKQLGIETGAWDEESAEEGLRSFYDWLKAHAISANVDHPADEGRDLVTVRTLAKEHGLSAVAEYVLSGTGWSITNDVKTALLYTGDAVLPQDPEVWFGENGNLRKAYILYMYAKFNGRLPEDPSVVLNMDPKIVDLYFVFYRAMALANTLESITPKDQHKFKELFGDNLFRYITTVNKSIRRHKKRHNGQISPQDIALMSIQNVLENPRNYDEANQQAELIKSMLSTTSIQNVDCQIEVKTKTTSDGKTMEYYTYTINSTAETDPLTHIHSEVTPDVLEEIARIINFPPILGYNTQNNIIYPEKPVRIKPLGPSYGAYGHDTQILTPRVLEKIRVQVGKTGIPLILQQEAPAIRVLLNGQEYVGIFRLFWGIRTNKQGQKEIVGLNGMLNLLSPKKHGTQVGKGKKRKGPERVHVQNEAVIIPIKYGQNKEDEKGQNE